MLKLKRGKKPGENGGYTKRKKKGSEKRRKKGYCERPYYYNWESI
jgi:hypothetical protein